MFKVLIYLKESELAPIGGLLGYNYNLKIGLDMVTLDFYDEVSEDIRGRFEKFIGEGYDNLRYHGVFDVVNKDVYKELNQYDVMLLPTRWEGEGFSGALIESKMADITAIVCDWHINSEIVQNGIEGIMLSTSTPKALPEAVLNLCSDTKKVNMLKQGAFLSRKRYSIETYRRTLVEHAS